MLLPEAIAAALGSATNYTITDVNGTLTVGQATLTITANDKSMTYGSSVPALDATYTGLVNGDTSAVVSGLSLATTATSSSNVGTYTISATGGTATNYTITDADGTLTVTLAPLTITANDKSMTYGGNVPALDATYSGLVNGDTSAVVSGLSLSMTATSNSNVGAYTISAMGGTAANYAITDVNGTLTVGQATLTIRANDKSLTYGSSVPALDATYTGLVNGDTSAVVSGLSLSTTATSSSNVATYTISATGAGTYPIMGVLGSLNAANYTFTFTNGTLTITPVPATPAAPTPAAAPTTNLVESSFFVMQDPQAAQASAGAGGPRSAAGAAPTIGDRDRAGSSTGFTPSFLASLSLATQHGQTLLSLDGISWRDPPGVDTALGHTATRAASEWARASDRASGTQGGWGRGSQAARLERVLRALQEAETESGRQTSSSEDSVVMAGVLATSGYLLLNSRVGLWLLSLLTSAPAWKQFDPMEVLFAWEEEQKRRGEQPEDEESLVSLVK
jgi:hypothetical protein